MAILILHLSDIHLKSSSDPILGKAKEIAASTYSYLPAVTQVFILVSGDVAFSGQQSEYSLAERFLKDICHTIKDESNLPVTFVITPGNHDCDFKSNNATRKLLLKQIADSDLTELDESVIDACTSIQDAFFKFRESMENAASVDDDKLWRTTHFKVSDKTIVFDCLNISWTSELREEPGKVYFPVERYTAKKSEPAPDLRIVVMHHPLNWFRQSMYRPFRTFIRQLGDIVITGHEHQGNVGINIDAETQKSTYIEGCVLQKDERKLKDSSYNIITIDLEVSQFSVTKLVWKSSRYEPLAAESWSDYRELPTKSKNSFGIVQSFVETLDDPGAFLTRSGTSNLSLGDVFVYPDLKRLEAGDRRTLLNGSSLLRPELIANGVLISGEEKSGRTTLLYQLYREYHDRAFVPVLVNGKQINKTSDRDIDSLIRTAVREQYGSEQITAFDQLSRSQKILLIDNLDHSGLEDPSARTKAIQQLQKRFGCLVGTVSNLFELSELFGLSDTSSALSLEIYSLQDFNYSRRAELISRWFAAGSPGRADKTELLEKRDRAERLINGVMNRRLIPPLPLYLLALLQSIDADRSGEFKESALGYYYQYLLTEAFQRSGVKSEKLTEIFQYCVHLAWYFHEKGSDELPESEIQDFNTRFSKTWHTVDFKSRVDLLLKARVLRRVGPDLKFRYLYIFYYFKGQYLSQNLSDPAIRAYITKCCSHLYVRDYANTILFLAHHTNDPFLLDTISDCLRGLFRQYKPVTLNKDTKIVASLVEAAPKLTYSGRSPEETRKIQNQIRDELDDGDDGLTDKEEPSSKLSLVAQLTMLNKTVQILGQVLKNQYSKIPRAEKAELINELFRGPLRALRNFWDFLEKYPEALIADIEAALRRWDNSNDDQVRNKVARRVVAAIVEMVTLSMFMTAADSANSESLMEDVRVVVARNKTLATKLIELAIMLDSPAPIPREHIKRIHREAKHDLIADRLIRLMVLRRLYMFKTTERDMQWLAEELGFDVARTRVLGYETTAQSRA